MSNKAKGIPLHQLENETQTNTAIILSEPFIEIEGGRGKGQKEKGEETGEREGAAKYQIVYSQNSLRC